MISAILLSTMFHWTFYYLQIPALKWHKFWINPGAVGLMGFRLNVDKTVFLTNEAHPPNTFVTKDGLILKVLDWNHGQKRLKCILTACGGMRQHLDFAYHMEKNTKTWHANRWMLKQKYTSICTKYIYFNACVQAMSCFGSAHRTLSQKNTCVHLTFFRKLPQSPSNTDLSFVWYVFFLH